MATGRYTPYLTPFKNAMNSTSSTHKIIVGIDYGTTFSGVSYVTTDKTNIDDITIISSWPGDSNRVSWKTPTRIAYSQENAKIANNKWGFEVTPKLKSYSWTKLLLDKGAVTGNYDDPALSSTMGVGMMHLPDFRDAAGVCEDFLREVYQYVSGRLRQQMTDLTFDNTPMECWITLPAVWSEKAQDATLLAAKNAGFGTRPGDEVFTIAEPEAAAIATLKEYSNAGAMNPIVSEENILICDCGGGTVDITTYKINQVQPHLTFDELCVGVGGKCGSTFIDRNLHALLSNRFGKAFDSLEIERKGPGSRFMNAFESLKRDFGLRDRHEVLELGPLNLEYLHPNVWDPELFDEEERAVLLSYEDMKSLFDPVILQIISLIEQQVKEAKDSQNAKINRIILVGGFGESAYLNKELGTWCERNGIILICPNHPQSAIVRGASLRGLEGIAPRVKRLRRHYGIPLSLPFREGIDPESYSFFDHFDNMKRCSNRIEWFIAKGEVITQGTFRDVHFRCPYAPGQTVFMSHEVYACSSRFPPEYSSDPGLQLVGSIQSTINPGFDFGPHTEARWIPEKHKYLHKFGGKKRITFGNKGNNLNVECFIGEKETFATVMKYD